MSESAADASKEKAPPKNNAFVSKLPTGAERFLARVVVDGLENGQRKPDDFIRHFGPFELMVALRDRPSLRARVLETTTGIKLKIALKKSVESCAEDLQIALDEKETDAETIVSLIEPDDRVRFLEKKRLWHYVTESEFWKAKSSPKPYFEAARAHVTFILESALDNELLTHKDIVECIGQDKLCSALPRDDLRRLFNRALELGRMGKPFTDRDLITAIGLEVLVKHVRSDFVWRKVCLPKIAAAHGFVDTKQDGDPIPSAVKNGNPEKTKSNGDVTAETATPSRQAAPGAQDYEILDFPLDDETDDETVITQDDKPTESNS